MTANTASEPRIRIWEMSHGDEPVRTSRAATLADTAKQAAAPSASR